jgi:cellulose synthase/poly-beta-1,6-N-acetylglucosamine synthase-like glycosyltransferase
MTLFATTVLLVIGIMLLIPTVVFFVEVLAGVFTPSAGSVAPARPDASAVIIIPAHNEEVGLEFTLRNVMQQLGTNDRVLVVADNCSDRTAEIAHSTGACVVERTDLVHRGKGFALAYGLEYLAKVSPDVFIILDADCLVSSGAISEIKAQTLRSARPVQILTRMGAPEGQENRFAIATWSWRVRNELRPCGLARLGLPCQLMGFGMGFPWAVAQQVNFAIDSIVEDLEFGLQLAAIGKSPLLYTGVSAYSQFPASRVGEISQRRRWEAGSFSMLVRQGWITVFKGILSANIGLVSLGLDMLVPPLVIHACLLLAYALASIASVFVFGASGAVLNFAAFSLALFFLSICLAWWSKGRDILPLNQFSRLFPFVLAKLQIHGGGKQRGWVRTDRGKD